MKKTYKQFLQEAKSRKRTSLQILGWEEAENFTGNKMSFRKMTKIAKQHAKGVIGNGSARVALEVDYRNFTTVMKIAKNERGFAQNLAEANLYKKYNSKPPYMVPMIDFDDNYDADYAWLHVFKANKFDKNLFFRHFKVSFAEFSKTLSAIINNEENENKKNPAIKEFVKFVTKNKLQLGEYRQQSNWGTYKNKPVILDAGLTKLNMAMAW